MAARPTARTAPNTPLLNKSNDGFALSKPQQLPTGRCNYTNLTVGGASPPRCGCQRFWDRLEHTKGAVGTGQIAGSNSQVGWCHCSHHACFHESEPARKELDGQAVISTKFRSVAQESIVQNGPHPKHSGVHASAAHESQHFQASISQETSKEGGRGRPHTGTADQLTDSALPDTSSWGRPRPAQHESADQVLPPIPLECLLPSDISSGNLSGNSQSFGSLPGYDAYSIHMGSGIRGQASVPNPPQRHLSVSTSLLDVPFDQFLAASGQDESFVQSATEVITPSPRGSPDLGSTGKSERHVFNIHATVDGMIVNSDKHGNKSSTHRAITTDIALRPVSEPHSPNQAALQSTHTISSRQVVPPIDSRYRSVSAHRTLTDQVQNHEIRLDNLENASFTNSHAEDQLNSIRVDIDGLDSRVDVLEQAQRAMNEANSVSSSRRIDDGNSSMISQTSSAMIASALNRAELSHRLGTLESQFTDFKAAALPSYAHPWKIEVVFLPFGSRLRGIWSTLEMFHRQRSRNNSMAADDRQTQFSSIAGDKAFLNNASDHLQWEDVHQPLGENAEFLVARACRQGSKVDERLRSRGLVKQIEVKGPDARDVHAAILTAFGDLPRTLAAGSGLHNLSSLQSFHALQASWIPLRKIHKDSRLRLLDPPEMVTSALWNVMFLSSSVAMRAAGVKRLYVTQRESYLQSGNDATDWTWQRLRVLPRVFPDLDQSSSEVGEADALEACWEYDHRLDPPPSAQSSFDSHHSSLSIRQARGNGKGNGHGSKTSQSSNQSSVAVSLDQSSTSTSVAPVTARALSPLMERFVRPLHSRTTSMPALVPLKTSPSQSVGIGKRRIASFDHELQPTATNSNYRNSPQSSPIRPTSIATTGGAMAPLSLKRRRISRSPSRPRDTPRWSGPPSPYYFEEFVEVERKRGTTPFAYATPHSNTPYVDFGMNSLADNDDDLGSTTDADDAGLDNDEEHDQDDYESDADHGHQPEDEAWEGVVEDVGEDEEDEDMEGRALSAEEDEGSDASSLPSEYPSKPTPTHTAANALYAGNKGAFRIHVDEEEDEEHPGQNAHLGRAG